VGLAAAIEFLSGIGLDRIAAHESDLLAYATEVLTEVPGLRIVGTAPRKGGVVSFVVDGIHPHDIGTVLDLDGVAVRTGHHCCQPLMARLGLAATARASFACYNTRGEVSALAASLERAVRLFT
jgi:cysteine desulfurase/selenocysteine lyase